MRILLFTNTYFPVTGGAEFVVHHLAAEFTRRGHSTTVLAPRLKGEMPAGLDIPYPVKRYTRPISKRFGVRQMLAPLLLRHWAEGFDVLHCHNAYPTGYVAATFKLLVPEIPVVLTCHGTDIMASERLRQDPRLDARIRKAVKAVDAVTAIGESMRREILDAGAPPENVRLIPNGVDWPAFQQAEAWPHPRPYVFSLGGFRPRKGFDVLLQAMKIVAEKNTGVDLLLAGDGREMDALRALHASLGLGDRVQFLGVVHGDDKRRLFAGCEFFVCPSRWEEPFGLINLEAMAAGKACVASRVGAIPDVVLDGKTGVLVEKDDPQALADAMLARLADPGATRAMGERGREVAKAYDWPAIADAFLALYAEQVERAHV